MLGFLFLSVALCANKILIGVTNHGDLGDTGRKTGWWLGEVAHPYFVFVKNGYTVDYVSPKGGFAPLDPGSLEAAKSANDSISMEFYHNKEEMDRLSNTLAPEDISFPYQYSAIFFAGGHGTMWDFPNSEGFQNLGASIYELGGVVSAVCHGPSALVNMKINGDYLIKGKNVTGFSNAEEKAMKLDHIVPFSLEDAMKKDGSFYSRDSVMFGDYHKVCDRVVTGENPASAMSTAQAVLDVLNSS